jgi:hypothetical protein
MRWFAAANGRLGLTPHPPLVIGRQHPAERACEPTRNDMQTRVRCMMMRGGTSKGAYFLASGAHRRRRQMITLKRQLGGCAR